VGGVRARLRDRVENDVYGTAWATLEGSGKSPRKVMLEAHVRRNRIHRETHRKDGFPADRSNRGQRHGHGAWSRLDILGDKGVVRGIIGNTAIHLRKDKAGDEKTPKIHELYVDVGASTRG
jgi:endoglucanase